PSYLGHTADSISVNIPGKGSMTLQEAVNSHNILLDTDRIFKIVTEDIKTTNSNKIKINLTDFKFFDWSPSTPKSYILKIGPYTDTPYPGARGCYDISAIGFVTLPADTNDNSYILRKNFPVSSSSHSCGPNVNFTFIGGWNHIKPYVEVTLPRYTKNQIQIPFKVWAIS
ncbi:hypothetical protein D6829_01160, partial [Candidatus Pacearchaeota archaeon]